jgi:hypothetical protein
MKKYLFIFPLFFLMVCAGSNNKRIMDAINSECGENCSKDEMVIKSDTVVSNKIDFNKRTLENISKIKKGMTISQMVDLVGPADCDCGCGIHVVIYALHNRSIVQIGTNDQKVLFVKHLKVKHVE